VEATAGGAAAAMAALGGRGRGGGLRLAGAARAARAALADGMLAFDAGDDLLASMPTDEAPGEDAAPVWGVRGGPASYGSALVRVLSGGRRRAWPRPRCSGRSAGRRRRGAGQSTSWPRTTWPATSPSWPKPCCGCSAPGRCPASQSTPPVHQCPPPTSPAASMQAGGGGGGGRRLLLRAGLATLEAVCGLAFTAPTIPPRCHILCPPGTGARAQGAAVLGLPLPP
jgi:hypothetical protein